RPPFGSAGLERLGQRIDAAHAAGGARGAVGAGEILGGLLGHAGDPIELDELQPETRALAAGAVALGVDAQPGDAIATGGLPARAEGGLGVDDEELRAVLGRG